MNNIEDLIVNEATIDSLSDKDLLTLRTFFRESYGGEAGARLVKYITKILCDRTLSALMKPIVKSFIEERK